MPELLGQIQVLVLSLLSMCKVKTKIWLYFCQLRSIFLFTPQLTLIHSFVSLYRVRTEPRVTHNGMITGVNVLEVILVKTVKHRVSIQMHETKVLTLHTKEVPDS